MFQASKTSIKIPIKTPIKTAAAAATALLLAACAQDTRPIVDPHNQVPFPGSKPVVNSDAISHDLGGPIETNTAQVQEPASDPRCTPLSSGTLKPAWRCVHDGVSYVLQ